MFVSYVAVRLQCDLYSRYVDTHGHDMAHRQLYGAVAGRARRTRVHFTRPDPALLLRRLDDSFTVAQSSSRATHAHEQVSCSCSPQRESQYRCASTPASDSAISSRGSRTEWMHPLDPLLG